jgi:DUF1680 family protein
MIENSGIDRRTFLQTLAIGAGSGSAAKAVPKFSNPLPTRQKLFALKYSEVRLTGGPLKDQFESVHKAYLALDNDRLLKVYRRRAQLPDPGEPMGGWYGWDGFAPGHTFGQYVSGLARFAAATGDAATRAKVKDLVNGFAATVAPDGYSYANLKASTSFPAYIIDKHEIGLLDAYRYAGITSARALLSRVVRGAVRYLPPRAIDRDEAPRQAPYDESYTLPENLFLTNEVTGDPYFFELAKRYLMDRSYFDPLSQGIDVLPGHHAYSHVNCLSSAAKAYDRLGERKYLQAAENAWDMIEQTQQFASGGWGPNETFVKPGDGKLGESLTTTHAHFETPCGAYAHLKLARYLIGFTGNPRYGDGIERVLYNTVLGAKGPKGDGHFFYYSDYHPAAQKTYFPDMWPCCSGTLPQVVADYAISAYFRAQDGIYVNLFTPSEVRWTFQGVPVRLIQTTAYPLGESIEIRLQLPAPLEFTLHIRMPAWLQSPASLAVNEVPIGVPAERQTFAAIRRRWRPNDTVQITLPFNFRAEPIDQQYPDIVALMRGPLMLVAIDPPLTISQRALLPPQGLQAVPHRPMSFDLQESQVRLRFLPFYQVEDEAYTTYVTRV